MNIKRDHSQLWDFNTGEQIENEVLMCYKGGKSAKATPAPIIEPASQNALFEAGEDDADSKTKKKKGKASLIVEKQTSTPNVAKSATKASGLSVGV